MGRGSWDSVVSLLIDLLLRIWVHSRMSWHAMLLSESSLVLGTRDVIQCAAVKECPWATRLLSNLGASFSNWIRVNKSSLNVTANEKEFFKYVNIIFIINMVNYYRICCIARGKKIMGSEINRRIEEINAYDITKIGKFVSKRPAKCVLGNQKKYTVN